MKAKELEVCISIKNVSEIEVSKRNRKYPFTTVKLVQLYVSISQNIEF
jgi:hypothetical protein